MISRFTSFTRLGAGSLLALAMGASGFSSAYAATTTDNSNGNGVVHFFDCLGELGNSAEHAANCGTVNPAPVPGGLSTPVHDGNFTCPVVTENTRGRPMHDVEVASIGNFVPSQFGLNDAYVVAGADPCDQQQQQCFWVVAPPNFDFPQIASLESGLEFLHQPNRPVSGLHLAC